MQAVMGCWLESVAKGKRENSAISHVVQEINNQDRQAQLVAICFKDWDLRVVPKRDLLHCVKTKARNFRLHGRF